MFFDKCNFKYLSSYKCLSQTGLKRWPETVTITVKQLILLYKRRLYEARLA